MWRRSCDWSHVWFGAGWWRNGRRVEPKISSCHYNHRFHPSPDPRPHTVDTCQYTPPRTAAYDNPHCPHYSSAHSDVAVDIHMSPLAAAAAVVVVDDDQAHVHQSVHLMNSINQRDVVADSALVWAYSAAAFGAKTESDLVVAGCLL